MNTILAGAALALALTGASAQTMPNANQTPESSASGSMMPNANRTPEGSNGAPRANGTTTSSGTVSPDGTTPLNPTPIPSPKNCIPSVAPSCPTQPCPSGTTPDAQPTPGTPPCPLPSATH